MSKVLFAIFVLCWTVTVDKPGRVIDGDTFDVTVNVWHHISVRERVRVLGIDTPEMQKPTMERAVAAKAFTESWLGAGPFQIESCKRDAFGRALGRVYRGDTVLADDLKKAGHGK